MIFWLVLAGICLAGIVVAFLEGDVYAFFFIFLVGVFLNALIFGLVVPLCTASPVLKYKVTADKGSLKQIANVYDDQNTFLFTVKGKPTSLTVDKPDSHGYSLNTNVTDSDKTTVAQYCDKSSHLWAPWILTNSCYWVIDTPAN